MRDNQDKEMGIPRFAYVVCLLLATCITACQHLSGLTYSDRQANSIYISGCVCGWVTRSFRHKMHESRIT